MRLQRRAWARTGWVGCVRPALRKEWAHHALAHAALAGDGYWATPLALHGADEGTYLLRALIALEGPLLGCVGVRPGGCLCVVGRGRGGA